MSKKGRFRALFGRFQDDRPESSGRSLVCPHRGSKPASKSLKTTGEPRRITTNKFRCVLSRLARSTADLVSKKGRFRALFGRFQDDRPESSGRSLVCPHRGSKPASKSLKTTGEPRRITTNKFRCVLSHLARSTADLVSKKGRFWALFGRFQDDRPESSGRSLVCPHRGSKPASKSLKTTGEPRRITTNKFRCVLSRLARSTADLVSKKGRFWALFGPFSGPSLVCRVAATLWLKTGTQVAQNDREATAHHGKQVLCRF